MRRDLTLLERIAACAGAGAGGGREPPTATEDLHALMESVRRHLLRLLNSRHGMCECLPDYGLPALSDLTVGIGDYAHTVQEAIQTAIEKYEPRLRRVRATRVEDEDQGRTLSFRVDALLVGRSSEYRVWYRTSLTGTGQFDVEA